MIDMRFIRKTLFLLSCLFAAAGCTYERGLPDRGGMPEEGMAEITFSAKLPASVIAATRGEVGTVPENYVGDIYVLAFDSSDGTLIYKGRGRQLEIAAGAENDNRLTFRATLPTGVEYTFMLLANAEDKLAAITAGASVRDDVLELLHSLPAGERWDADDPAIPMWGEQVLTLTASSAPSFTLTRMSARINLMVTSTLEDGSTANFRLTSIRYYNYNTSGMVVPADGNFTGDGSGTVTITAPTLPDDPGTRLGEALLYDGADITDFESCLNRIYIFEAAQNGSNYYTPAGNTDWVDNPCIVVGGQYSADGSTWQPESYYRIDFIRKVEDTPGDITQTWLSILRNFSYNVDIVSVSGGGYADPDVALLSAPMNMEAVILDWEENDMGNIVFDGTSFLSVSEDSFMFSQSAILVKQTDNVVDILTDYVFGGNRTDPLSGWRVDRYEHADGTVMTPEEQWLTLVPESGSPDVRTEAYFLIEANDGLLEREANVWIAAGRLRFKINVIQRVVSLDIVDADETAISEMIFVVPATGDRTHAPQTFTVNWTPVNNAVAVTYETPVGLTPFLPSWLSPDPSAQGWIIPGGTGTQTYTVQPPAVTDSELATDPFYQHETVFYFEAGNGTDSEKKGISLSQIYYNILAETFDYRLNGGQHVINVRSNTDWVITEIEEWLYNVDPSTLDPADVPASPVLLQLRPSDNLRVGTGGGNNVSGQNVSFSVVNNAAVENRNKWGTVYVTFENPDGKFPPYTVAMTFPKREVTLLGLGYARDVRGFNVAYPTTFHLQSLNRLLTSSVNFGRNGTATVVVDGLKIVGYNAMDQSTGDGESNWDPDSFRQWLNLHQPDIVVMSYSMRLRANEAALLRQYLDNGGAVVMYYGGEVQTASDVKVVMDAVFGRSFSAGVPSSGSDIIVEAGSRVYAYNSGAAYDSEPALNGPFMDVRGMPWGTHLGHCHIKATAIQDQARILSMTNSQISPATATPDAGYANIFIHNDFNFMWIGNGMGTSTYYTRYNDLEYYHDPNRIDSDFRPTVRTGFGALGGPRFDVYNTYFFANAMAWAISASNYTPPASGY